MVLINLIPESRQLARARWRRLKGWSAAIMTAVVMLAASVIVDWCRQAEAAELRSDNERLQARFVAARSELRSVTIRANEVRLQLERANALRSKRSWSGMLALIGRRMPAGSWLTSISTDPATPEGAASQRPRRRPRARIQQEVPAVVVIDAPRKLRVEGYATTAGEPHLFVTNLKDTDVFSNVELKRLLREPVLDGFYFHFELLCEW